MMIFIGVLTHKNRFLYFVALKLADVAVMYKNGSYIRISSYTLKNYFLAKSNIIMGPVKGKLRTNDGFYY